MSELVSILSQGEPEAVVEEQPRAAGLLEDGLQQVDEVCEGKRERSSQLRPR